MLLKGTGKSDDLTCVNGVGMRHTFRLFRLGFRMLTANFSFLSVDVTVLGLLKALFLALAPNAVTMFGCGSDFDVVLVKDGKCLVDICCLSTSFSFFEEHLDD